MSNQMMNRISFCVLVASILSTAHLAAAQAKVRSYTTPITEPGLLAAVISQHGMGRNSSIYLWEDGRIETRHPTSPSTSALPASEHRKLQVRTKNADLAAFPDQGPSVTFRSSPRRRCKDSRPAQAILREQEDGRIIVSLDGCLGDGAAPEAMAVTRDGLRVLMRRDKSGVPVVSDDCGWRVQIDLGRLGNPTQVTIDLGVVWAFEVSWDPLSRP